MRDFLHRHVLHNLGLKLISLGLAVGLWLAVARNPVAEVAVEVPIEFHNIPQDLEISSENIPRAQIRLRGPEREFAVSSPPTFMPKSNSAVCGPGSAHLI